MLVEVRSDSEAWDAGKIHHEPAMWRLIATGLIAACLAVPAPAETWTRYTNSNFGTSIEIPSSAVGVIHKSGKGRTWMADDRTLIAVEAEDWTEDFETWQAYHQDHLAGMREEGIEITEDAGTATTFTVWGRKGDGWIFLYVTQSARCRNIAHGVAFILLEPPKGRHRRWIGRVKGSLTDEPSTRCP